MLSQYLWNVVLAKAILSWFIACTLKTILHIIKTRRLDFRRFVGNGGMPSSHTTFVVALATATGQQNGFDTTAFALACALALVVMADAAGVRRAAGKQAKVLNEIVEDMQASKTLTIRPQRLKELIGHTPLQVICGAVLGICASWVL